MKTPENYRVIFGPMASDVSYGNNGVFQIPLSSRTRLQCIVSDGEGWEHVSVVAYSDNKMRTPTWAEMCKIKDMFWNENECVVQFHPPKSEYVNNHPHCLHLWKPQQIIIPTPPKIMVGI
jgi:hypothetical protein